MANSVRNIAPFINENFIITSEWWKERINPVTGEEQIHRGLDITTATTSPVYSMLNGIVHSKGYDDSQGNWIVIKDNNPSSTTYGYATLYMHLLNPSPLNVNDVVSMGEEVGTEGSTGSSTGLHLHVEMQNINRFNWEWHWSYTKSDYLDPTVFMGIDNIEGTTWIYNDTPYIPPTKKEKHKFPWVLYTKKLRNKSHF